MDELIPHHEYAVHQCISVVDEVQLCQSAIAHDIRTFAMLKAESLRLSWIVSDIEAQMRAEAA